MSRSGAKRNSFAMRENETIGLLNSVGNCAGLFYAFASREMLAPLGVRRLCMSKRLGFTVYCLTEEM